jgi:hypothetical protein
VGTTLPKPGPREEDVDDDGRSKEKVPAKRPTKPRTARKGKADTNEQSDAKAGAKDKAASS